MRAFWRKHIPKVCGRNCVMNRLKLLVLVSHKIHKDLLSPRIVFLSKDLFCLKCVSKKGLLLSRRFGCLPSSYFIIPRLSDLIRTQYQHYTVSHTLDEYFSNILILAYLHKFWHQIRSHKLSDKQVSLSEKNKYLKPRNSTFWCLSLFYLNSNKDYISASAVKLNLQIFI